MSRPDFSSLKNGKEFDQWYWTKAELEAICQASKLPTNGSKANLRARIIYALDNEGAVLPSAKVQQKKSRFNWAREVLTLETVITDNVSFGPNFRRFMKAQIGARFVCHSDFMNWVKANSGQTLADAVLQWQLLEDRKKDPTFKRVIAQHNRLAKYVRDFLADNPGLQFQDALRFWQLKRQLPAEGGLVIYEKSDLSLA